jgi:uncharacterized membrane protein
MSDNDKQKNGASDGASTYNVITVSFEPDDNAYEALTVLKELDGQDRVRLEAATVVVRDDDGQFTVKDHAGSFELAGTAGGGMLGLLLGVIGGPIGVLVGGTYGLLVGSLFDLDRGERNESVLGEISEQVRPGHTALLAEVTEQSSEVVDTAMARIGGTVLRRPVADVEAEIAAAEKAQREAKRAATKELVRGRREHTKEQVQTKVKELKSKMPHREKAGNASS